MESNVAGVNAVDGLGALLDELMVLTLDAVVLANGIRSNGGPHMDGVRYALLHLEHAMFHLDDTRRQLELPQ